MNRKWSSKASRVGFLFAMGVWVVVCRQVSPAVAQEQRGERGQRGVRNPATQPAGDLVIKLVQLKYANPREVAENVQELSHGLVTCRVFEASNHVAISGSDKDVEQAIGIIQQSDQPAADRRAQHTKVYALKHGNAKEMAKYLLQLGAPIAGCVPDERTNSLIITADGEGHANIEELLKTLDVPRTTEAASQRDGQKLAIFPLKHARIDDSTNRLVEAVMGNRTGRYALDLGRNQVVVTADSATIDRVADLLKAIDVPPTPESRPVPVRLRVVWLITGRGGDAPPPPEDMKEVVAALGQIGVQDLSLVAQTVVQAFPGKEFKIAASPKLERPWKLTIEGEFEKAPGSTKCRLKIEAAEVPTEKASEKAESCRVETSLSAPPGHTVVLGVTPTGERTSAFVLQVLPGSQ